MMAVCALGGPAAAALVALIGSTELREIRGKVPWYGSVYNHAACMVPAVAAAVAFHLVAGGPYATASLAALSGVVVAGGVYYSLNQVLVVTAISLRDGRPLKGLLLADVKSFGLALVGLAPLAWLMADAYINVGPLSILIFALPLYTTRASYQSVVELRDMFTQTVRALASAIDARDPSTKKHSEHVSSIATDIGKAMGCSEKELEQLEWGGLLHDIGKIGVRDAVLLKPGRLDREERMLMNEHPVKGEEILKGVGRLAPELPIIRHHHEWYNGSGYPDRLAGEQIPYLARILHVADAFEAMTASRPYRPVPLTREQAMEELRKYTGIQFDPRMVEAFGRTKWAAGFPDAEPEPAPVHKPIPVLGQVAALRTKGGLSRTQSVDPH
ncbi:MAG: HD-GYP domain-containing protein [Chloroflexota bacterium]|nr:HD-GYP domain-containing protein [Chloroflexota bacterium]